MDKHQAYTEVCQLIKDRLQTAEIEVSMLETRLQGLRLQLQEDYPDPVPWYHLLVRRELRRLCLKIDQHETARAKALADRERYRSLKAAAQLPCLPTLVEFIEMEINQREQAYGFHWRITMRHSDPDHRRLPQIRKGLLQ